MVLFVSKILHRHPNRRFIEKKQGWLVGFSEGKIDKPFLDGERILADSIFAPSDFYAWKCFIIRLERPQVRLWRFNAFLLKVLVFSLAIQGLDPVHGQSQPLEALGSRFPSDEPISEFGLVDLFPKLHFEQPVAIASPPGETNRLFVVERLGRIVVITNLANPTKSIFLDVRQKTDSNYIESGLLGLAFHPGFATNGFFFTFRTGSFSKDSEGSSFHDVISRYSISQEDPNVALPESEVVFLAQMDADNTHNAGDLHFGPDGYLYIAVGESKPPPREELTYRQSLDKSFFGGILRIDVDRRPGNLPPNPHPAASTNYAVPKDNPFIGITQYQGRGLDPEKLRTEFYAIGFRNPWRFSFDPLDGTLVCGDVGGGSFEEINLVESGGNYGWPFMEGNFQTADYPSAPPEFSSLPPLVFYEHGSGTFEGKAVIGGLVYRGKIIPQLQGAYLFGDNLSGHIWSLHFQSNSIKEIPRRLTAEPGLSAFGVDPRDGEILIASLWQGKILRLVYVPPEVAEPVPQSLASTGLFSDTANLSPHPNLIPYEINVPFWSDHALKSRWFSLPDSNSKIAFSPEANWSFPAGSIWVKHFELELTNGVASSRRRLETRVLVKTEDNVYGLTYRWGDSTSDATLVPAIGMDEQFLIHDNGSVRTQVWHYPSRAECKTCHTAAGGFALGFNTAQLNRPPPGKTDGNQIKQWDDAGLFANSVGDLQSLRRLVPSGNTQASIYSRVRSFFAANCVHCHQPGGGTFALWDARLTTPLAGTRLLDGRLINPHSLPTSYLYERLTTHGFVRMPPIATSVLDTNAIELIAEWINTFPPSPWAAADIGTVRIEGSSAVRAEDFQISGSGTGLGETSDAFHFLSVPLQRTAFVEAKLDRVEPLNSAARGGLMLRGSGNGSSAPYTAITVTPEGNVRVQFRAEPNAMASEITGPVMAFPIWLRLVSSTNSEVVASVSADGVIWNAIGKAQANLGNDSKGGLFSSSYDAFKENLATF
ncbi:MAG: PQQ-dependent sugar dehydrogenase, partial [Verrucomicrobiota bacterium]